MSKKEKIKEYNDRHHYWRDKVFSQLGFSINFFITFGIAFLIYLLDKRNDYSNLLINSKPYINFEFAFYLLCVIAIFSSIIYGGIAILSRLFDLRITSHIMKVRKKTFKKLGKKLPEKFPLVHNTKIASKFIKLLFKKFNGLNDNSFENYEEIKKGILRYEINNPRIRKANLEVT
ncbi:hypothetical protein [Lacinutrix himadriensis]|uniref:hypothetical protein n=1 Tax=Lacinutrix himadriensis TaxID=641549 RepID=UPI0006E21099|nr:hypothetical protein [Lacinutrix himadriensis]